MDINEAALRLRKIEVIESQIRFLREQSETDETDFQNYATDCNDKAQELCLLLKDFWL